MDNQSPASFVASPAGEPSGGRRIARIWSHGVRLEAIANLAHELRTPVQVLLGYLDILRDEYGDELTPKPRELIERMNANVHDLAQTIENVMHFVLAEAGAESIVDEDLSIEGLIAEIMPTLEAANHHKRLRLEFDVRHAPRRIKASRRALRSIILNLGLNAIKFTESGGVRLEIRRGTATNMLELELTDTGPGLNPALLAEAMRPFAQLSNSSARRYRGLGLGLAVVQRQITAMNGQLELRPREGGGSVFVAAVPVKIVEETTTRLARAPLAPRKPAQAPPPLPAVHRKPARNPL
jgi:signal transduction histidine kinase